MEVITAKSAYPNPNWVNFVVTAKARASIRQYLKNLRFSEALDLGRRLLDQALRDSGTALRKIKDQQMQMLLDEFGLNNTNELFEQLGLGQRLAPLVAKALLQGPDLDGTEPGKPTPIAIAGTEGLVVSYARCCHPIPGDDIMGYLSAGRGVVIHRNVCGNLGEFRKQPNKWISVNWQAGIEREFSVEIKVEVEHRPGVLAEVAARIGESRSNIEQVSIDEDQEDSATLLFSILVKNRRHLAEVIRDLRRMTIVKKLSRTCT